jgi:hypothetical protein
MTSNARELAELATAYASGNGLAFRNRLINADMRIDQRNAGASVTPTNGQYLVDRWLAALTNASRYSAQQNAGAVTPPAGFSHYLGIVSLSAYAVTAADTFAVQQRIEGFNVADLAWGTAAARPVTLSFWVRSSLTGTFGGALTNAAANRSYPFSYAIAAANTWELKTVVVPGDATGTWLADNGVGLALRFGLGSGSNFTAAAGAWGAGNIVQPTGSVSVVGTNAATWQVTGVQCEAGSVATPFERRPYGTELQLCQRYYFQQTYDVSNPIVSSSAYWGTNTIPEWCFFYPQQMRVAPTITVPTVGALNALESQVAWRQCSAVTISEVSDKSARLFGTFATNGTFAKGQGSMIGLRSTGSVNYSAEL